MKLMLAGKAPADLSKLRYPVLASPKLDGIRAFVQNGVVVSRNNKPIPNATVQKLFGKPVFDGLDGELIVGDPTAPTVFRDTTSMVMSDNGTGPVHFNVFDYITKRMGFDSRLEYAWQRIRGKANLELVEHVWCANKDSVELNEKKALDEGYEGLMIRDPYMEYKHGRSTTREGGLLKLKRFEDSEAVILAFEQRMHNANDKDASGKRTSHKAGMVGRGDLGAIRVQDLKTKQVFHIGSGFSDSERSDIWKNFTKYRGRIVTYRYFPTGSKDLPRFPTFKGFREDV